MENDSQPDLGRWVEDRISSLSPASGWSVNAAAGRELLERAREVRRTARVNGLLWSGAAAVVVVSALALPGTRVFAKRCVDVCLAETNFVIGKKVVEGRAAPDFTLPDALGNPLTLSALRGQVVLLNFWATWCPPCNAEIPLLGDLQERYRASGLVVLGVSMDEGGWTSVRPWMSERAVSYPMMIGDSRVAESYGGVKSLPTTFLIARDGRIAKTVTGLFKDTYEADIQALLAER
jgi:cytochrome c biogenesis protein CcmG/thiol:disulfide interchange protein DsbE